MWVGLYRGRVKRIYKSRCSHKAEIVGSTPIAATIFDMKNIDGYNDYCISPDGSVTSFKYNKARILKTRVNKNGYLYVNLCKDGKYHSVCIHRLVAKHFLEEYTDDLQVNHIDGNKRNNNVSNLEMVSASENLKHAVRLGLLVNPVGEDHPCSKITKDQVLEIREKYQPHIVTMTMLAEEYDISKDEVKNILYRKNWKHL